jgi:hypothetical protein
MLRDAGAKLSVGREHPLVTWLGSGSRECLAALIENNEGVLLEQFEGDTSFLLKAIRAKNAMLPVLASTALKQTQAIGEEFPPEDVKGGDRRILDAALELKDVYLPYAEIATELKAICSPWAPLGGPSDELAGQASSDRMEDDTGKENEGDVCDLNFDQAK